MHNSQTHTSGSSMEATPLGSPNASSIPLSPTAQLLAPVSSTRSTPPPSMSDMGVAHVRCTMLSPTGSFGALGGGVGLDQLPSPQIYRDAWEGRDVVCEDICMDGPVRLEQQMLGCGIEG